VADHRFLAWPELVKSKPLPQYFSRRLHTAFLSWADNLDAENALPRIIAIPRTPVHHTAQNYVSREERKHLSGKPRAFVEGQSECRQLKKRLGESDVARRHPASFRRSDISPVRDTCEVAAEHGQWPWSIGLGNDIHRQIGLDCVGRLNSERTKP
jgi:hypothetical protein